MTTDITKRLYALLVVLVLGLSSLFLLPKTSKPPPPGVLMTLPDFIGEWYGQEAAVTQREKDVLGSETRFARKQYTNGRGDAVFVSIVLAGEDMSASIHRPERCLPAQGYTVVDQRSAKVPLDGQGLTTVRLHNIRPVIMPDGKPVTTPDGKQVNEFSLIYYWFVGSTETTASHTARYIMDSRDRLINGANQPWAYVTVMGRITANLEKFGRTEDQTDEVLQKFIQKLVPAIQQPGVKIR